MKFRRIRCLYVILAAVILAALVGPSCAGAENCSMPCCRHKAQPVSHHSDPAHSKPCCTQKADASSDTGSGCRFDQPKLALPPDGETAPILAAAPVAAVLQNPTLVCASAADTPGTFSYPPDAPLFLRLRTLLI